MGSLLNVSWDLPFSFLSIDALLNQQCLGSYRSLTSCLFVIMRLSPSRNYSQYCALTPDHQRLERWSEVELIWFPSSNCEVAGAEMRFERSGWESRWEGTVKSSFNCTHNLPTCIFLSGEYLPYNFFLQGFGCVQSITFPVLVATDLWGT